MFEKDRVQFYCATMVYHVELSAISDGSRHLGQLKKKSHYSPGTLIVEYQEFTLIVTKMRLPSSRWLP